MPARNYLREAAIRAALAADPRAKFYESQTPCRHGHHNPPRYLSTDGCAVCAEQNRAEVKEAVAAARATKAARHAHLAGAR